MNLPDVPRRLKHHACCQEERQLHKPLLHNPLRSSRLILPKTQRGKNNGNNSARPKHHHAPPSFDRSPTPMMTDSTICVHPCSYMALCRSYAVGSLHQPTTHWPLTTDHCPPPTKPRVAQKEALKLLHTSVHWVNSRSREEEKRTPYHLARGRTSVCSKSPCSRSCNVSSLCRRRNVRRAGPAERGPPFLWESARVRTGNVGTDRCAAVAL
jgi:hypothetical protein